MSANQRLIGNEFRETVVSKQDGQNTHLGNHRSQSQQSRMELGLGVKPCILADEQSGLLMRIAAKHHPAGKKSLKKHA
jgi:hypothetical protein